MYEYHATIKRVIDGDTVVADIDLGFNTVLHDEHIRLYFIDAPERRSSDLVEKHFGELAKEYVEGFLQVGEKYVFVSRHFDQNDKYGRTAGDFSVYDAESDCWRMLTELLLRDHHAVKYREGKRDIMEAEHQRNRELLVEKGKTSWP